MMLRKLQMFKGKMVKLLAMVAVGCFCAGIGNAQTPAPSLPPGVQDIVKLSQAGLSEDVILTQVKNAGATYNLNADQLIYLSKSGVSQNVIKALMTGNAGGPAPAPAPYPQPQPGPPPSAPDIAQPPPGGPVPSGPPPTTEAPTLVAPPSPDGTPAPPATFDYFHQSLAPYGTWAQSPEYGWYWRPSVAQFDPGWRPYGNEGHWIYTDTGWFWQSDYPWGDIPFHYGRWFHDDLGWAWVPRYNWAPSWVTWRNGDGYCGWAPLPPGAVFRAGIGLEYHGVVAADIDFGLGWGAFAFVPYDHFWDLHLHSYFVPHDRAEFIFHHSVILNGYRFDHGRFFVDGLGRDRIGLYTHHDVRIEFGLFHGRDYHRDGFHDDHHDDHHFDGHDGHDGFDNHHDDHRRGF
jgi:hypothetical protein